MSYNIAAEQYVLGALLVEDEPVWKSISSLVSSHDFSLQRHRQMFDAMLRLSAQSKSIDLITIREELVSQGIFEQVGGWDFLMGLFDETPSSLHVEAQAEIVRLCAFWRRH